MSFSIPNVRAVRWWYCAAVAGIVAGCGGSTPPAPAMSDRDKANAVGNSRLPGAAGVRAAEKIADSAAARRARLDSIARQP